MTREEMKRLNLTPIEDLIEEINNEENFKEFKKLDDSKKGKNKK